MREFFKGWRRKAGVVTLVMACVVMGMWVRSFVISDVVAFPICHRDWHICPVQGYVYWQGWSKSGDLSGIYFQLGESAQLRRKYVQQFCAIRDTSFSMWVAPYWSLALPLTLLSAYLILWKPRKQP